MAKASTKPSAKAPQPVEKTAPVKARAAPAKDAAPVKDNRGRELLELRIRWKIINETVEAGIVERKRLREAIDALSSELKQTKGED